MNNVHHNNGTITNGNVEQLIFIQDYYATLCSQRMNIMLEISDRLLMNYLCVLPLCLCINIYI